MGGLGRRLWQVAESGEPLDLLFEKPFLMQGLLYEIPTLQKHLKVAIHL